MDLHLTASNPEMAREEQKGISKTTAKERHRTLKEGWISCETNIPSRQWGYVFDYRVLKG